MKRLWHRLFGHDGLWGVRVIAEDYLFFRCSCMGIGVTTDNIYARRDLPPAFTADSDGFTLDWTSENVGVPMSASVPRLEF